MRKIKTILSLPVLASLLLSLVSCQQPVQETAALPTLAQMATVAPVATATNTPVVAPTATVPPTYTAEPETATQLAQSAITTQEQGNTQGGNAQNQSEQETTDGSLPSLLPENTPTFTPTPTPTATAEPTATETSTTLSVELPPFVEGPVIQRIGSGFSSRVRSNDNLDFVKIGFHDGPEGSSIGITEWMETLDAQGIPFFLKSADHAGSLYEAQQLAKASGVPHVLVRHAHWHFDRLAEL